MRHIAFPLLLIAAFYCCPVLGQKGPCTEDSIRAEFNSGSRPARTDDFYLFNPLLEKPAVGLEDLKKAQRTMATQSANRKNAKAETKLDRVVVAPSGDMAYGFGETHFSYDEGESGKHIDATTALLSVWRADGGVCKLAASMIQREGQR